MQQFLTWLSRQSLQRLVGVLFGNSRELELLLAVKDQELERVVAERDWFRSQYQALTDSWLLARGNKPTDPALVAPLVTPRGKQVLAPSDKLAIEVDADNLMDLLFFQPQEFALKVEDLEKSQRPRDKELLRRVKLRFDNLPEDSNDGVIIGPH